MHIVLTDLLTCPRCGPEYGLILLADDVVDRRVRAGALGCSNCRERYPVGGKRESGGAGEREGEGEGEGQEALRLAALLGVTGGPGFLLIAGPGGAHDEAVSALIEDVEVLVVAKAGAGERMGVVAGAGARVSHLLLSPDAEGLPLVSGKLLGVALTGEVADRLLEEGARVVSPVGRLVLDPAPADAVERLTRVRMRPIAEVDGAVVAARDPRAG